MEISNILPKVQEIAFLSAKAAEEGNKENWLALFDDNAIIEDPVGESPLDPSGEGHKGKKAIENFWDNIIGPGNLNFVIRESYPCGFECANVATITNTFENGTKLDTDLVIIYRINEKHKLVSLRAFWNYEETVSDK